MCFGKDYYNSFENYKKIKVNLKYHNQCQLCGRLFWSRDGFKCYHWYCRIIDKLRKRI